MIDWSKVETAEARAASALEARVAAAKGECGRRIEAVAALHTQANINALAAAGLLSAEQREAYVEALRWIAAMRAAWRPLAEDPRADLSDDANWPECPPAVQALAREF